MFQQSAFGFGFDLMTTIGRFGFGASQALSSRYTSLSVLFWIALVQLFFLYQSHLNEAAPAPPERIKGYFLIRKGSIIWIMIVLLFGRYFFLNTKDSILHASERQIPNIQANTCVLLQHVYSDLKCLKSLYPVPAIVVQRIKVMEKVGLWQLPKIFEPPTRIEPEYGQVKQVTFKQENNVSKLLLQGTTIDGDFVPVLVAVETGKAPTFLQVAHLLPKTSVSSILFPNHQGMNWEIKTLISGAEQKKFLQVWLYLDKEHRMAQISKKL